MATKRHAAAPQFGAQRDSHVRECVCSSATRALRHLNPALACHALSDVGAQPRLHVPSCLGLLAAGRPSHHRRHFGGEAAAQELGALAAAELLGISLLPAGFTRRTDLVPRRPAPECKTGCGRRRGGRRRPRHRRTVMPATSTTAATEPAAPPGRPTLRAVRREARSPVARSLDGFQAQAPQA